MTRYTISDSRMLEGTWTCLILAEDVQTPAPRVAVFLQNEPLAQVALETQKDGCWILTAAIPVRALSDGVQTILAVDQTSNDVIGFVQIDVGGEDISQTKNEVALLRAELDMLKRAFRRHCLELEDRL